MTKSVKDWIEIFLDEVPNELTQTRWEHSLRVADHAEKLAIINHHSNPRLAYLAGIVHDITKQKKMEFHIALFQEYGSNLDTTIPEEAFHAFSSVFYLQKKFDFHEEEVFSAISSHTLGKKDMSLLDKILYASDFLGSEYAFKQNDYHQWVKKTEDNLYFGIHLKANKTLHQLMESKRKIYQTTIDTYNETINKI